MAAEERRPRKGEVSQKEFANSEDSFHNREIRSGGRGIPKNGAFF